MEYNYGILIDYQGYFMGGLRWEVGTPAPNFRLSRGSKVPQKLKVTLLTSDEAVQGAEPNGRWTEAERQEPVLDQNGDPVLDANGDPVTQTVKFHEWQFPTEERWIVQKRRDLAGWAFLVGKIKVWPQRLPRLPEGQFLVDVAPPVKRTSKPSWKTIITQEPVLDAEGNPVLDAQGNPVLQEVVGGEWVFPTVRAIVGADGTVKNFVNSLDPADTPIAAGEALVDDPAQYTGVDEIDETVPLDKGDTVTVEGGAITAVTKKPRRFAKHPVKIIKRVLQSRGQLQSFITFAQAAGVTVEDLDEFRGMGLGTKIFRDWLASEGFTLKQAFNVIEAEIKAEKQRLADLEQAQQL